VLFANAKFFSEKTAYWKAENRAINNLSTPTPLRNAVGLTIRKELAMAGLIMEILQETYCDVSTHCQATAR
jgi:hypothetical protein